MKDLDFAHIAKKLKNTRIAKNLTQEYVANIADVNVSQCPGHHRRLYPL